MLGILIISLKIKKMFKLNKVKFSYYLDITLLQLIMQAIFQMVISNIVGYFNNKKIKNN